MIISSAEFTITKLYDGNNLFRAWANAADGSQDFSTTESSRDYMGTYVGLTAPLDTERHLYKWTWTKGMAGDNAVIAFLSNDSIGIVTQPDGTGGNLSLAVSAMTVMEGATDITLTGGYTFGFTVYPLNAANGTMDANTFTLTELNADNTEITISATKDGKSFTKIFSVSKNKIGTPAITTYLETDTQQVRRDPLTGALTPSVINLSAWQIIGQDDAKPFNGYFAVYEKSQEALTVEAYTALVMNGQIEVDSEYVLSDQENPFVLRYISSTPQSTLPYTIQTDTQDVTVRLYSDELGTVTHDMESISVVSDGKTPYVHIAFADDINGSGMVFESSTNKAYMGTYTSFEEDAPQDASLYKWTLTKGATVYTWQMYADDVNGAGMSSDPAGKKYLGLAHNKLTATPPAGTLASAFLWSAMYDTAIIEGFSTQISDFETKTLPAMEDGLLTSSEKIAVENALKVLKAEKTGMTALVNGLLANARLASGTALSDALTAYSDAYGDVNTAVQAILAVADGVLIGTQLKTNYTNAINTYAEKLGLLQTAIQTAQQSVESKILDDAAASVDGKLSNYVDLTKYGLDLEALQGQIDGNITTWFREGKPTLANYPASEWTTTGLKNVHLGDIYYDDVTKFAYRFMVDVGGIYSWSLIKDSDITKAIQDAKTAQDTADGKRRVFFAEPTPPYDKGDLWSEGANGDLKICVNAKASGGAYAASDWSKASKYTDDTVANQAVGAAGIANTNINSLRQAQQEQIDVRLGMKIGYSTFTTLNANSIYISGIQLNEETFKEELADINGSIYLREKRQSYTVPKQALSTTGAPAGKPIYIAWDNTSSQLYLMHYVIKYAKDAEGKDTGTVESNKWQKLNGTEITFNESVFVLGEIEIA